MIEYQKPKKFIYDISRISGEEVKLERRVCDCGHVMSFIRPYPQTCRHCGRLVYPNDKIEFLIKMKKELKK